MLSPAAELRRFCSRILRWGLAKFAKAVSAQRFRRSLTDLADEKVEHVTVDPSIAIVAVVGENMHGTPGVAGRTFSALGREGVNIIAIAQGSSECNISFVVSEKDVKAALTATHREFGLGAQVPAEILASSAKND